MPRPDTAPKRTAEMSSGITPYDCPTCGSRGLRISGHWNPIRWQVECLRGHVVDPGRRGDTAMTVELVWWFLAGMLTASAVTCLVYLSLLRSNLCETNRTPEPENWDG